MRKERYFIARTQFDNQQQAAFAEMLVSPNARHCAGLAIMMKVMGLWAFHVDALAQHEVGEALCADG